MPALSFSAVEVLPALLNRTKTQTIRPLPARMKIGDIVTLYWKQRISSIDSWFCKKCGNKVAWGYKKKEEMRGLTWCHVCDNKTDPFPKILGQVRIIDVFEIEMNKMGVIRNKQGINLIVLACLDGFLSVKDMFNFFNTHYDLSKTKNFVVYRWEWIK